jgi:hypothetical protein
LSYGASGSAIGLNINCNHFAGLSNPAPSDSENHPKTSLFGPFRGLFRRGLTTGGTQPLVHHIYARFGRKLLQMLIPPSQTRPPQTRVCPASRQFWQEFLRTRPTWLLTIFSSISPLRPINLFLRGDPLDERVDLLAQNRSPKHPCPAISRKRCGTKEEPARGLPMDLWDRPG